MNDALTKTEQLALDFIKSPFATWPDFAHANGLGLHGMTREAQAVRMPPRATFAKLESKGLLTVRAGLWVAA